MLKLRTTVAACLALSAIGGILAYATRPATSRNADTRHHRHLQGTARAEIGAGQATTSSPLADNLLAQAFRQRVVRSGTQTTPLAGNVQIAGSPLAGAKVTLYAAGTGAPAKLAEGQTNGDGAFRLDGGQAPQGSVLYLVAKGGTPKAAEAKGPNNAIGLLAVLGTRAPNVVTVNELTTVASTFTARAS